MNLEGRVMEWSCPDCGILMLAFGWKAWGTQWIPQNLLVCRRHLKPALRVRNRSYCDLTSTCYYIILSISFIKTRKTPPTCLLIFKTNVTRLVKVVALEKSEGKNLTLTYFKKQPEISHHQIKVGSYLILLGRGLIQQVCSVSDCSCLHSLSKPFRD